LSLRARPTEVVVPAYFAPTSTNEWLARRVRFAHTQSLAFPIPPNDEAVVTTPSAALQVPACRIRIEASPTAVERRALQQQANEALLRGERRIVMDCSSWTHFDLVVLSTLVRVAGDCQDQGVEFELENLNTDMSNRIEALRIADRLGL
jgi:anti-anti-sigma regulatory factor